MEGVAECDLVSDWKKMRSDPSVGTSLMAIAAAGFLARRRGWGGEDGRIVRMVGWWDGWM